MSTQTTIFHEFYGTVTRKQLAAYRKYNVSQSDHDDLVEFFGNDYSAITGAVLANSPNGMFDTFQMMRANR